MITLGDKQYIESQKIRVFPCAYRGYYPADETLVFDPEARATTEANFTNTFHKLSDNKESYVIAWVPNSATDIDGTGTLKCVIGGYYFEIYNHRMSNFFYQETDPEDSKPKPKPYYLCIKTESISLGTSKPDSTRTTKVLSSFAESTNYLDVKDTQGRYAFTGLLVSKTADESATASLAPFIATPKATEGYDYKIDPTKLSITNLLDVGSGNYSIRMIEDDTEQGSNTTIASGDYSVALGLKTEATGEASAALGNNTTASSRGAFAVGNNTNASGEGAAALGNTTTASGANAVALGTNTKAEADNQVVIGAYNEKDDNQAFIVANGTADSNRSNKFTVSKNGDVKALGTLETNGNIKATGNSNNALELGTSAAGSSGSIRVYGTEEAKAVFTVESTGKTTISGATTITEATTITGATTITNAAESNSTDTGALQVIGGVGIARNLNVGGKAEVADNLKVGGELSVAADKATTLGGSLTTKGTTILEDTLTTNSSTTLKDTLNVKGFATLEASAKVIGTVTITEKATSTETTDDDTDTTLTTKSYVDAAKNAAVSHTDEEIKKLAVIAPNVAHDDTGNKGNGAYIKTISQTNGKIKATKVKFATTFDTVDNSNAPTTSATDTHIKDVISNLWEGDLVKNPNGTPDKVSLQTLILDAIYPIGSIYMQYVAPGSEWALPETCPLATTLTGSEWELIKAGLFLRAASGMDYGQEGGSADAVLLSHTHAILSTVKDTDPHTLYTSTTEAHSHNITIKGTKPGGGVPTGVILNSGNKITGQINTATKAEDDDTSEWVNTVVCDAAGEHSHSINLNDISTASAGGYYDDENNWEPSLQKGKGANLPPYLNVCMWKRIK